MTKWVILFILLATPAVACHRFSIWKYPWAQPCGFRVRMAQQSAPLPPPPVDWPPVSSKPDIPLPSLEGMDFPPDATGDWDKLKGIGLLRQLNGTN